MNSQTKIAGFFRDKNVFITGGTGFMGKILIEKLLRSCNEIGTIYILMREKRTKTITQRKEEIFRSVVFSRIKQSGLLEKVVAIPGDIQKENLGISDIHQENLIEKVALVFNCAASVKFDEPLKQNLVSNLLGTKRVLDLCHKMKNIEALVHTSTAYSNCDRDEIDEIIYPQSVSPSKILNYIELYDDNFVDFIAPKMIGKKPNTYTFSKSLTEVYIQEKKGDLPIAIIRPSVVGPSFTEPIPGWVDNRNGLIGFIMAHGSGIMRSAPGHKNKVFDFVPLDISTNLCIAAAWHTATYRPESVLVYNMTANVNAKNLKDIGKYIITFSKQHPTINTIWYPSNMFIINPKIHKVYDYMMHLVPAKCGDFILKSLGKKPTLVKHYDILKRMFKVSTFFMTHEFKFHNENVLKLWNVMTPEDKEVFNFDMKKINWETYWSNVIKGVNKYMHNMDDADTMDAKKRLNKLYWMHQLLKIFLLSLILTPVMIINYNIPMI